MSKLTAEIERLQRLEAKIKLYSMVIANLEAETEDPKGFPGLTKEVGSEVIAFCKKMIATLEENPSAQTPKPLQKALNNVDKLPDSQFGNETADLEELPKVIPKKSIIVDSEAQTNDPLKFIVKYKDWNEKKVAVADGAGNKVEGTVKGASFPHLKVEINNQIVICNPRDLTLI